MHETLKKIGQTMKKNIWIINHYAIPPAFGGLVRHTYFTKHLTASGYEVKIFTSSQIHNSQINMIKNKILFKEKKIDDVNYIFVKTNSYNKNNILRIKNIFDFPINLFKTVKYFSKPDIIYTSSPDPLTAAASIKLAKKYNIECCTEIRDLWPESIIEYGKVSRKNPVIFLLYKLEKWIYINSDKLIFTIEGGKEYLKEKGIDAFIDSNKVFNINNGVDLEEFQYNKQHYTLDDKDLNDLHTFKIIYTGSIRKVNNLGRIVDAAQFLQNKKYDDICFLIYGDGDEKKILEKRCIERHLHNIKFKDRVERKYIPYILSKANVNLYHWEKTDLMRFGSSGNKLFDYLASAKPILSTVTSNYNLIDQYKVGINTEDQTPEEIEKSISQLYHMSNNEYSQMCENALNAAYKYDYKKLTEKLIDIIEN
jgi:glycosyltransferase involved in cell wall biosynthesis